MRTNQQNTDGITEDTLIRLFFLRHLKPLIKEAFIEFLKENDITLVTTKQNKNQLLTTQEALEIFGGVNRHTLYRFIAEGLPTIRIGRAHRFKEEDIQNFIQERRKRQ